MDRPYIRHLINHKFHRAYGLPLSSSYRGLMGALLGGLQNHIPGWPIPSPRYFVEAYATLLFLAPPDSLQGPFRPPARELWPPRPYLSIRKCIGAYGPLFPAPTDDLGGSFRPPVGGLWPPAPIKLNQKWHNMLCFQTYFIWTLYIPSYLLEFWFWNVLGVFV